MISAKHALAVSQVRQETPLSLPPSVLRAAGIRTAQLGGGCSLSELTTQSYTLAPLRDVVAIALGYGAGAQLASLGTCVQVILPPDFAFSAGWDAPPAGALFHLEDDLNGLILAPVGSAPPSEFPEWSLDFFLPAAIPTLDSGFNALTFTGVSGTRVEEFVASFGGAVTAVFRFNSATQQYETFTLGAPAFVNTLTTLQQGDALLLAVDRTAPFSQIDLLPASGMRRIALRTGSNLVSYTGASGPIDDILGEVPRTRGSLRTRFP